MKTRSSLFRKYLIAFVGPAWLLLLIVGAANLYFSWQDKLDARLGLQRASAEAAADHIEQRLEEILRQIGATTTTATEQDAMSQREREVRLLHARPGITDVLLLDRLGRERLFVPRSGADVSSSGTDYSRNAAFQEARTGQPYFSPVYYRSDDEPRITLAMAVGPEQAGVTVAEIDLRFLLDGLPDFADDADARAKVIDAHGQVIALAAPDLQLRKASLAPAQADRDSKEPVAYAIARPLGWRIAIEQAQLGSRTVWYAPVARSAALLLAGMLLAAVVGIVLARRLVQPLHRLQESAERIAQGAFDERADTGGGLESLANTINRLGANLRDAATHFERRVDECTMAAQDARHAAELACARMKEMTAGLPLAVFQFRETATGECGFTFVGENVCDMLGVSAAEILADQQACWRTTLPDDRMVIEPLAQHAIAARQAADFQRRVRFGGTTRWIRTMVAAPRQTDGGWIWIGCWLDQTQEREREEELRADRDEARAQAMARSAFLANISHEIRTPLNTVIGLSHLALKAELPPQQREHLTGIHDAGSRVFGIISDILDFARCDAGSLVLDSTDFALSRVMENAATAIRPAAIAKGLALTVDIPRDLPAMLSGDPSRLEQILGKLADNAVTFTDRGEITLRAERVYSTDRQVMLRFVVRDTGRGMTFEQRRQLFQVSPVKDAAMRRQGGLGLGLLICKRLVEAMGGELTVESWAGAGSTFSFTARFGLVQSGAQPSRIADVPADVDS